METSAKRLAQKFISFQRLLPLLRKANTPLVHITAVEIMTTTARLMKTLEYKRPYCIGNVSHRLHFFLLKRAVPTVHTEIVLKITMKTTCGMV